MKQFIIICAGLFSWSILFSQEDGLISANFHQNVEGINVEYESNSSDKSNENAMHFIKNGIALNGSEDYHGALKEFDKAIHLNSDMAQAYDYRAVCYIRLGKYRKAISDLREAIDIDSKFVDAYNHLGIANYWLANYQDAINCYNMAISLNPEYGTPYFNRAIVYLTIEENVLALKDLNKAKDLNLEGVEPVIQQFFADKK
jgi:tetratricopeptide (TPR) repeat protein